MTSSAGKMSTGLLGPELDAIQVAAAGLVELASIDPETMSREELADAVAVLSAASERVAMMAGRFMDVGEQTAASLTKGERSMISLVSSRTHLSRRRADQLLRAGTIKHRFRHFHDALMQGRITTGHTDLIVRLAKRCDSVQLARSEKALAALAVLCTPEEFQDKLAVWEAAADPTEHLDEFIRAQARRHFSWAKDLFGNIHFGGTFEPSVGEQIVDALLDRRTQLVSQDPELKGTAANHDALVDLILGDPAPNAQIEIIYPKANEEPLAPQSDQASYQPANFETDEVPEADARDLAEIHEEQQLIHAAEGFLGWLSRLSGRPAPTHTPSVPCYRDTSFHSIIYPTSAAGVPIPPAIVEHLAATGRVRYHALDAAGELLHDRSAGRQFTANQRRMIRLRDNHCQHRGCRMPARYCHYDHITPWSVGGPTLVSNGQLLCGFHHRWKNRRDPLPPGTKSSQFDDSPVLTKPSP